MGYIPHFGLYSIFFWVMGYIQFGLYSIWVSNFGQLLSFFLNFALMAIIQLIYHLDEELKFSASAPVLDDDTEICSSCCPQWPVT